MTLALFLLTAAIQVQNPPRDTRATAAASASGIVSGLVVSDEIQPRPLRRARVTLAGQGMPFPRVAITADDGSFRFDGVPAGRATLTAIKDGYVPMAYGATRTGRPGRPVQIGDQQSIRVTIRLPRGAVITGAIVDVDGLPAPGIRVSALVRRYVAGVGEYRYTPAGVPLPATSDDRGVYRVYGLPEGDYVVSTQPSLQPQGEVRTIVRGAVSDRGVIAAPVFHPAATDLSRAARVMVRAGEERSGVDVQLHYVALARVSGMVSVGPGWTRPGIIVSRSDEGLGFAASAFARADADGRFTLGPLPPGQYRLLATSGLAASPEGPGMTASADVTLDGEDVTNIALDLQPALTLAGRVAFEGEKPAPPISGLKISLPLTMSATSSGRVFSVQIGDGNTFRIDGIVPGAYRPGSFIQGVRQPIGGWWLKSFAAGGRDLLDAPLDLRQSIDDAVVTFTDRASEIAVTVSDARGAAVADALVVVFSIDRAAWFFNSRRVAGIRADRSGRYVVRNLPPGEYRVAAADLDANEWFDPAVLERLLPLSAAVTITGAESRAVALTTR